MSKKTTESIPIAPQPWPPVKPKSRTKVRFLTAIIALSLIATFSIGANAASISFLDSVRDFFGFGQNAANTTQSLAQPMAGNFDVTPLAQTVNAGSTQNYSWRFEATDSAAGINAIMTVPLLWTDPQSINPGGQGYVSVTAGTCAVTFSSVTGRTIIINQPSPPGCLDGQDFTINYNQATAPAGLGNYTFDSEVVTTDPVVTVVTGTTTDLVSSDASSDYLQSVTFTATVSPDPGGGSVSFYDGGSCAMPGSLIGTDSADGGTAEVSTSSLTGGSHTIIACFPGFSTFGASEDSVSQSVASINQDTVTITAPATLQFNDTFTLVGGGGNAGAFSFSAGSSTGCSVSGSTLSVILATGTCDVTATRAGDSNYNPATSAASTVALTKDDQDTVTITAPATLQFNDTFTLVGGGGNAGAFSFSAGSSTGCAVSGSTLSVILATGTCDVTATRAGDSNYNPATSAASTVALTKDDQDTVTITAPATLQFNDTFTLVGGGGNAGAFSFSAGSSTGCAVSGSTLSVILATGTCDVTATRAGDSNYNPATSAASTVALTKDDQDTVTITAPATLQFNDTFTLVGGGGNAGAFSFSAGSSTGCAVSGSTLSVILATGTCDVTATRAGDSNYNPATSAASTVALTKDDQDTVTITAPATLQFNDTFTLVGGGGNAGAFSFSAGSSTGCSVSGSTLSVILATGTCDVTATRAGDSNYNPATSAASTVALTKDDQDTVTITAPATLQFNDTFTLVGGGGNAGAFSFSAGSSTGCSVSGSTLSVILATGTCDVTATRAGDSNYNPATSAASTVALTKDDQDTVTITAPATLQFNDTFTLVGGGGNAGAFSFSAGSSTGCAVSGSTLSVILATGTCDVTATRAGDSNYNPATSAASTVALTKDDQDTVTITAPATLQFNDTFTLVGGGGNAGAFSFSAGSSTGCAVSGSTLSVILATGTCDVTATRAGDSNYNPATSAASTVALTKDDQTTTFGATLADKTYGDPDFVITPPPTASSGLDVSMTSLDTNVCDVTVSGSAPTQVFTVDVRNPGVCTLTATQGGSSNYEAAPPVTRTFDVDFCPTVSIPVITDAEFGDVIEIPVNSTDLSPATILSAQFKFRYNATVLQPVNYPLPSTIPVKAGTLNPSGSFSVSGPTLVADNTYELSISNYSGPAFDGGAGSIAFIQMKVIGSVTAGNPDTSLVLADFAYNTPVPDAICENLVAGSLEVVQGATTTVVTSDNDPADYNEQITFTATVRQPPAVIGSANVTGFVDFFIDGNPLCVSRPIIGITGTATCEALPPALNVGDYDITATYNGDTNFSPSTSAIYVQDVEMADQTITFGTLADKTYGDSNFNVSATATSGLTVTFSSTTPGTCSVLGVSVSILNVGECTIVASQDGDTNWNPALDVPQSFDINKLDLAVTATAPAVQYGAPIPAITIVYTSFVTGGDLVLDDPTVLNDEPDCLTTYTPLSEVSGSAYPITCSGGSDNNYNFTFAASPSGSITVTKRDLAVTATAPNIVYGDPVPAITKVYTSFFNSDDAADLNEVGDSEPTCITTYDPGDPVSGSAYPITCSGGNDDNYNFTFAASPSGTITVGKRILVVTPSSHTVAYGDPVPTITASYTNFYPGDTTIDTPPTCSTTYTPVSLPSVYPTSCDATLALDDNYGFNVTATGTVTVTSGSINGSVRYLIVDKPIGGVTLDVLGGLPTVASDITEEDGTYGLSLFGSAAYTVRPRRDTQPCGTNNGITGFDASLISRHIVGLTTLSSDQLLAANVSGTPSVSSFDAALIARSIVCLPAPPANASGQWKFTPAQRAHSLGALSSATLTENYQAYMMGDVNGDFCNLGGTPEPGQNCSQLRPAAMDSPRVSLPTASANTGADVTLPLRIENLNGNELMAYQFDIRYNPGVVEPARISEYMIGATLTGTLGENLSIMSNVVEPGLMKVVVYGAAPVTGDGIYANLRFRAIGAIGTSSAIEIERFGFNAGTIGVLTTDGLVSINSASNGAAISGRVMTPGGQSGLRNARVTLTSDTGETFAATTGTFGYFQFGELTMGRTYTVAVESRRFRFTPVTVALTDNLTTVDLIGQE